jgi:hypothetical protein
MTAYNLHDRYFDPVTGHISSYFCQLFILIGQDYFQYCLLDTEKSKFIALADFRLPSGVKTPGLIYSQIENIIAEEELLRKKYPSVVIGVDTPHHTLVPAPLFDKDQVSEYLGFNFRIPENYQYIADHVQEIDAYNVCGFPEQLKEIFSGHFAKAAFVHSSTAILKATYYQHKINPESANLFLNVRSNYIDLVMFEGSRPVLFNSFSCMSREDLLYYTLFVIENSSLRPDQVRLCLGGMINEDSESYRLLAQYIGNLSFCSRLSTFNYSAMLEQVPAQRYQDLFALALCGS